VGHVAGWDVRRMLYGVCMSVRLSVRMVQLGAHWKDLQYI